MLGMRPHGAVVTGESPDVGEVPFSYPFTNRLVPCGRRTDRERAREAGATTLPSVARGGCQVGMAHRRGPLAERQCTPDVLRRPRTGRVQDESRKEFLDHDA